MVTKKSYSKILLFSILFLFIFSIISYFFSNEEVEKEIPNDIKIINARIISFKRGSRGYRLILNNNLKIITNGSTGRYLDEIKYNDSMVMHREDDFFYIYKFDTINNEYINPKKYYFSYFSVTLSDE